MVNRISLNSRMSRVELKELVIMPRASLALRSSLALLDNLPKPPPKISAIVTPHLNTAKELLKRVLAADDDAVLNEAALVAQSCAQSALARLEKVAESDAAVVSFQHRLVMVLSGWAIKDMTVSSGSIHAR